MDALEKIRVVTGSDLTDIAMTVMDMVIIVDRDTPVAAGTCPMPLNPYPKQFFIITSRVNIASLTMNSGGKTIHGNVTSLAANTSVGWIYDDVSDSWFPLFNSAPAVTYARVSGSNATTTGQTLVDVTGLTASLLANSVYEIEAMLSCAVSAVTTGNGYGVNFSAAGATIEGFISGSTSTTAQKIVRVAAFNTAQAGFLTTSGMTGGVLIKATVTTGTNAGNLTVQHLKTTSGTSTVHINSTLKVTRIS